MISFLTLYRTLKSWLGTWELALGPVSRAISMQVDIWERQLEFFLATSSSTQAQNGISLFQALKDLQKIWFQQLFLFIKNIKTHL